MGWCEYCGWCISLPIQSHRSLDIPQCEVHGWAPALHFVRPLCIGVPHGHAAVNTKGIGGSMDDPSCLGSPHPALRYKSPGKLTKLLSLSAANALQNRDGAPCACACAWFAYREGRCLWPFRTSTPAPVPWPWCAECILGHAKGASAPRVL